MTQLLNPAAAIAVALFPAAFVLWRGRSLARLTDDPALAERLLAGRSRNSLIVGFSVALLGVEATTHLVWLLPLLILGRMAAAYPLRRTLYGETWTLGAYLSFFGRLILASLGFWILLGVTPALILGAGAAGWIAAILIGATLLVWNAEYSAVFRWLLRATPVANPGLVARFAQMLADAGLPDVRLEQVDLHGGVFANAVAVPSIRRPAVVVSETLIARLDEDETMAILGHELGHLEHHNARRLKRRNRATQALIVVAAGLTPAVRAAAPEALAVLPYFWLVVMVLTLALMARHRQQHETSSDLRAIAFTGDSEALVRALSKVHALALLPRRWDAEFERRATHPSLARRIQAIRAAAGTAPATLSAATAFNDPDGQSSVTFHEDHLVWVVGRTSASHSIQYDQLTELRINAKSSGAPRLIAVETSSRRWESVLRTSDVARAQATLDIVDTRLGRAASPPPVVSLALVRVLAAIVMLVCVTIGQYTGAIAAWLAFVWPMPPLVADPLSQVLTRKNYTIAFASPTNGS